MKTSNQNKMLCEFATKKNARVGAVVALQRSDGTVGIGYSLCNKSDEFSKTTAIELAKVRAREVDHPHIPQSLHHLCNKMAERAKRYFKNSIVHNT